MRRNRITDTFTPNNSGSSSSRWMWAGSLWLTAACAPAGRGHPPQPAVRPDPGHAVHVLLLPAAGVQPAQRRGLRLRTLEHQGHGEHTAPLTAFILLVTSGSSSLQSLCRDMGRTINLNNTKYFARYSKVFSSGIKNNFYFDFLFLFFVRSRKLSGSLKVFYFDIFSSHVSLGTWEVPLFFCSFFSWSCCWCCCFQDLYHCCCHCLSCHCRSLVSVNMLLLILSLLLSPTGENIWWSSHVCVTSCRWKPALEWTWSGSWPRCWPWWPGESLCSPWTSTQTGRPSCQGETPRLREADWCLQRLKRPERKKEKWKFSYFLC